MSSSKKGKKKKAKALSQTVRRIKAVAAQDEGEASVYRNWCNWVLSNAGKEMQIFSLKSDLKDGVLLCNLVEALTGATLKYRKKPTLNPHYIDNINVALSALRDCGHDPNINPQDVVQGDLHTLLGFLWGLIQRFQMVRRNKTWDPNSATIYKSRKSPKQEILQWVENYLSGYPGIAEKEITKRGAKAFTDGQLLFCLVHKTDPDCIMLEESDRNAENLINKALNTANTELGVPKLITSTALKEDAPDERSLLTYLFAFRATIEDPDVQEEMRARREGADAAKAEAAARRSAEQARQEAEAAARAEAAKREEAERLAAMAADKKAKKKSKKDRNKGKFRTLGRSLKGSGFETIRAGPQHRGVMCPLCSKQLDGQLVVVKNETYHNTCFVCTTCSCSFTKYFWAHETKPYCLEHYLDAADMRCSACGDYIRDDTVTIAQNRKWHATCFVCTTCKAPFDESYFMWEEKPYCSQHYFEAAGDICAKCNRNIEGNVIAALDQKWHADCFTCDRCDFAFLGAGGPHPFFGVDDKPVCTPCNERENSIICGGCQKAIDGDIIAAMGAKWHPECFVCHNCRQEFTSSYVNVGGKPFCSSCARRR